MAKIDKKLEQIRLQHEIIELMRQDNGVSCHFDYHLNPVSDTETVKLNLLTYNPRHHEYMLFHSENGSSSIECLEKMLVYLKSVQKKTQIYSFSIYWKRKGEEKEYISYFRAPNEQTAESKFLHEKNPQDFTYRIVRNPIS